MLGMFLVAMNVPNGYRKRCNRMDRREAALVETVRQIDYNLDGFANPCEWKSFFDQIGVEVDYNNLRDAMFDEMNRYLESKGLRYNEGTKRYEGGY